MNISRSWEMPNSKTFEVKAIRKLILKYAQTKNKDFVILDPYANEGSIKTEFDKCIYINNDLDPQYDTTYHLEAQEFLGLFEDESVDLILNDPPYSPRQVSECYKKLGKTVTWMDTSANYYSATKLEIMRVLKPNGIVITCGWNSNGVGSKYDLKTLEILMVAHGAMHNDTIVTVEQKLSHLF